MASITAATLDKVQRTTFYRLNAGNVPVQLPFDLLTIDGDFQGYQPITYRGRTEKGDAIKGTAADAVFLARNLRLPRPAEGQNPDRYGVWEYHGV
jgi:hypothetical protein